MAKRPSSDVNQLKRAFRKSKLRDLVLMAAQEGVHWRLTRSGVMFYGQNGYSFTVHATNSDHRAEQNAASRFRKIGIELPRKGK